MANKNIQLMDTTGNNLFPVIADSSVTKAKLAKDVQDTISAINTNINNLGTRITNEASTARAAEQSNKNAIAILNGDSNTAGSVKKAIADLIGGAPEAYDTLKEIADYIAQDKNAGAALTKSISDEVTRAKAAEKTTSDSLTAHTTNKSNPHGVTKAQVGLGNVDNTSDANKPVSTATQTALNNKVDKVNGKSLVAEDLIAKLTGLKTQAEITSDINAVNTALGNEVTRAKGAEPYEVKIIHNSADLSGNKRDFTYLYNSTFNELINAYKSKICYIIYRDESQSTFPTYFKGIITDVTDKSFSTLYYDSLLGKLCSDNYVLKTSTDIGTKNAELTKGTIDLSYNTLIDDIADSTNRTNESLAALESNLDTETSRAKAAEKKNADAIAAINTTLSGRLTYKEV